MASAEPKLKNDHKSAVVIIPPEEVWDQIQVIRSEYDKAYERWMPHINMLYPFLPDKDDGKIFEDAAKSIVEGVRDIRPFTVTFSREAFGYFGHRKNCTLWLKPLDANSQTQPPQAQAEPEAGAASLETDSDQWEVVGASTSKTKKRTPAEDGAPPHASVMALQSRLEEIFPQCKDLSKRSDKGFAPHLSLGQFKAGAVKHFQETFQQGWKDIEFEVKEIHLISRVNFNDKFHIRQTIPLGEVV